MSQGPFQSVIARNAAGSWRAGFMDLQGGLGVSGVNGGKYALNYLGLLFSGANQTGQITTAALTAVYTGLCLSNPAGNTKNLILRKVQGMLGVAPAAITPIGLITGFAAGGITVHTTLVTPLSGLVGSAAVAATGKLDSACTLVGTPVWQRWFSAGPTATSGSSFVEDMESGIIIPPGGYAAIGTLIASPAAGLLASMEWNELPL